MNDINEILSRYKDRGISLKRHADYDKFPNQDRPLGIYKIYTQEDETQLPDLDIDTAKLAYETMIRSRYGKYIVTNPAKTEDILKWYIRDKTGKYNVTKGLYVFGDYSTGKTVVTSMSATMMAFAKDKGYPNGHYSLHLSYKRDIMMRAREDKDITFLSSIFKTSGVAAKQIIIDDMGYEDDAQLVLWGNKENLIIHMVEILHSYFLKYGTKVVITSNLPLPDMMLKYGKGTHDRIVEMCTPVLWSGGYNYRTGKKD